jgi:hypothetical protein
LGNASATVADAGDNAKNDRSIARSFARRQVDLPVTSARQRAGIADQVAFW